MRTLKAWNYEVPGYRKNQRPWNSIFWIGFALAALGFGTAIGRYSRVIDVMGRRIPHDDILPSYVFALAWSVLIGASIVLWPVPAAHRPALIFAWVLRSIVTMGVMPLMEYNATVENLDAFRYFIWSKEDFIKISDLSIGDGTFNVARLVALHNEVFPDSFRMLIVSWSAIGLVASYIFYRSAVLLLGRDDQLVLSVSLFLPSMLYWSSILGKDPLQYLAMSLYTYGFIAWVKGQSSLAPKLFVVLGVLGSMMIRTWYGPLLVVPLAVPLLWGKWKHQQSPLFRLAAFIGLLPAATMAVKNSQHLGSIESSDGFLGTVNSINQGYSSGGSAIAANSFSSISEALISLPMGMFTVLFRPLPGELPNAFGLMAGLENLVVLLGVIIAFGRIARADIRDSFFLWATSLVILWAAMYALTASTNLGTLARYRLQIQPILLGLLVYILSQRSREDLHETGQSRA